MTWWRIEAPWFCAGLAVADGVVVDAAPILRWAKGSAWGGLRRHFKRRGWHGQPLEGA